MDDLIMDGWIDNGWMDRLMDGWIENGQIDNKQMDRLHTESNGHTRCVKLR